MKLLLLMVIMMMFQPHKLCTVVWDGNGILQDKLTRVLKQVAEVVTYFIVLSRLFPWRCTWSEGILPNSNIYILYQWQILIRKSGLAERCNAVLCTVSLDLTRIRHWINTHTHTHIYIYIYSVNKMLWRFWRVSYPNQNKKKIFLWAYVWKQ